MFLASETPHGVRNSATSAHHFRLALQIFSCYSTSESQHQAERIMSSSRQKSCLGCVRSKRKCDQGFPKCRRCLARRIDCEYTGRVPATEADALAKLAAEDLAPSNMRLQLSPATAEHLTPYIDDPFLQLGNDPFSLANLQEIGLLSPAIVEDPMNEDEDAEYINTGVQYQARVEFAAKRLASAPKSFAEKAQTMFIHRRLFKERSPPDLQDALSACALYCMKNSVNEGLVFANLEQKAQRLMANTNPFLCSTSELLAAVQALLIYQTIRLFDGDIRQRAQAEADEAAIMELMEHLKTHMQQLVPSLPPSAGALSSAQATVPGWHDWLFEESIRRTVFSAYIIKGVYEFLKFGYDKVSGKMYRLCFTAQTALWDAQSEHGWRTAYRERERLEVRMGTWDEDMVKATPDDLDEMGVIVMATYWGMERTEEWLGKSQVAKYGLEES